MNIRRTILVLTLAVAGSLSLRATQQTPDLDAMFQAALYKEQVELKLGEAVAAYQQVVAQAGSRREVAAKALLQMAGCYERLGDPAARTTYEKVVAEYGPDGSVAAAAKSRLVALEQAAGMSFAQVWDEPGRFVSRDGRYLSFTDWNTGNLALHDLRTGRSQLLTTDGSPGGSWGQFAVASPDGRAYAYHWLNHETGNFELRVISRDGGRPRVIYSMTEDGTDEPWGPWGWTPDGKWVLTHFTTSSGPNRTTEYRELALISTEGKPVRRIKRFDKPAESTTVYWLSPDGRHVAYDRSRGPGLAPAIHVLSIETGQETFLPPQPGDGVLGWFPTSDRILITSRRADATGLWAVSVKDGRIDGEPESIRQNVDVELGLGFSTSGDFFYTTSPDRALLTEVYVATVDPATGRSSGSLTRLRSNVTGNKSSATWSPDGSMIAYQPTTPKTITVQADGTGEDRQILVALETVGQPRWLPDNQRLAVIGRRTPGETNALHVLDIRTGEVMTPSPTLLRAGRSIGLDGRAYRAEKDTITAQDLSTGAITSVKAPVGPNVANLSFSPDGNWIAFLRREGQTSTLQLMSATTMTLQPLATTVSTWQLQREAVAWSADSHALFVTRQALSDKPRIGETPTATIWRVPVDGTAPSDTGISWAGNITRISAHPDGRRLALSTTRGARSTWVLHNLPHTNQK